MVLRLLEESTFLRSLFENVSDAILVVDKDGTVTGANAAFEKMTGWSAAEVIGHGELCDICRGVATCSEESTCVECFSKKSSVSSFEMQVRTRDGKEIPVVASSTRLPEIGHGALVLILRDMSEQQRAQRERHQRQLTRNVIEAQEAERKRISRDLHDGIGQALFSIMVGLKVVNQLDLDPAMREHLDEVQKLTAKTLDEVKNMSVQLRPSALDDLGLVPAVRSYAKGYQHTFGIRAQVEVQGKGRRYRSEVETAVYRIYQEAMINVAKYAQTEEVIVRLHDTGDLLELIVEDRGVGFDPENIQVQGTGLGLFGMRERADLIGGKVDLISVPGKGTTVRVTVPVQEEEASV